MKPQAKVLCGAKAKATGQPCRMAAGLRTDHPGEGRCWLHGGRSPVKSGRYSTVKHTRVRELLEEHRADPTPLDLLPDLALVRALAQDYVDRYQETTDALLAWHASFLRGVDEGKPKQVLDLADAVKLVAEATRVVKRIEDIRAANAVSVRDLDRVLMEWGRVVKAHVHDDTILERIQRDWLAVKL